MPIIAFLTSAVLAELAIRGSNPSFWVVVVALAPFIYQILFLPKRLHRKEFWGLGVPLWLFGIGSMVIMMYVPGQQWQEIVGLVSAALVGLYLETEFSYLFQPSKYVPFSMERVGEVMLAAGAGMTCMGFLGLDFLGLTSTWQTMIIAAVWATVISASALFIYRLPKEKIRFLFVLSAVSLFQLYWVLQFFPITFVVTGAIAGILIACFFTLTRYAALESLDKKTLWRTISTGGLAVVLLLMSSRWS